MTMFFSRGETAVAFGFTTSSMRGGRLASHAEAPGPAGRVRVVTRPAGPRG